MPSPVHVAGARLSPRSVNFTVGGRRHSHSPRNRLSSGEAIARSTVGSRPLSRLKRKSPGASSRSAVSSPDSWRRRIPRSIPRSPSQEKSPVSFRNGTAFVGKIFDGGAADHADVRRRPGEIARAGKLEQGRRGEGEIGQQLLRNRTPRGIALRPGCCALESRPLSFPGSSSSGRKNFPHYPSIRSG